MIKLQKYEEKYKSVWNQTVVNSRNATFLFHRSYMDYHAQRIQDASLLFFDDKDKCIALFPASVSPIYKDVVYSHHGLTYGGLLLTEKVKTTLLKDILRDMAGYYIALGYKELVYKPIPYIYHRKPTQEDLYWLFLAGAKMSACNLSTTIDLCSPILFSQLRKRKIHKAQGIPLVIKSDNNILPTYWGLLESVLKERHDVSPVHSLSEITYLATNFPDNIKLYTIHSEHNELLAGVLLYMTDRVAHAQYIAASKEGRELGALDLLFSDIISEMRLSHKYFDFGISTEKSGQFLNEGLVFQKEGFGGHGVCYDVYNVNLQSLAQI